jgi:cold-inducible RNA-binding protein
VKGMAAEVEYRCFVGGLAWATDGRSLEQAFSQYGEVLDSKVGSCVVVFVWF